jgi:hypothetical protein
VRWLVGAVALCVGCLIAFTALAAGPARPVLRGPSLVATGVPISLRGAAPGLDAVSLERRTASRWVEVDRAKVRNGRFHIHYAPHRLRPRYRLRVTGIGGAVSNVLTVRSRAVTLAAVGDVNLADNPGRQIAAHGAGWPWGSVGSVLRAADLAFANLECSVSRRGAPVPKDYNFRANPAYLRAAHERGGLDLVNLANNHTGDYGAQALTDTIHHVKAAGMIPVGAGSDERGALTPRVVEVLGLKVAFVGFSQIGPIGFAAGPGHPGTAWATPENVRRAVLAARRRADVVIATFHWGIEKRTTPTPEQVAAASVAIAAGATAVIGGHPHVLQPVVVPRPRRVIAYSMGNFVFGASSPGTTRTGILELRLTARGVIGRSFRHATIVGTRPVLARRG